tara:strand:- start:116 stop:502 length:387 start_codon:yes stop_codon:yes gene_type:complete
MATQIVIGNGSHILVDDNFHIDWADKGKNWNDNWLPGTIHYVVWNSLGPNEIQNKDANGMMTGNSDLSATSDAVGTTTIAALLTWGETRKLQIEEAVLDYETAVAGDEANGTTNAVGKTWRDYDPNYS